VTLEIARSIFALTIWLIDRFAVDSRACRSSAPVMLVDVIDVDD
jgi:hypothetical protein